MLLRLCVLVAIVPSAWAAFVQQATLVGSDAVWVPNHCSCVGNGVLQGVGVAISANGATAVIGGSGDSVGGAVWVFIRNNAGWVQQGPKLPGVDAVGSAAFGSAVAVSADGNTALAGGPFDSSIGAIWVFTRVGSVWTQQGNKLVGSGVKESFGWAVALSADGNTAVAAGATATGGALWVFTRNHGLWTQQGDPLTGAGIGYGLATSVAISGDGNTIIAGGAGALVFTRNNGGWSQQGGRLNGNDSVGQGYAGWSVALSSDGNTAMVGAPDDDGFLGASWIFTRTSGVWTQQGSKLTAPHVLGDPKPGLSASLSADGNTALSSVYVFTRDRMGVWSLSGFLPMGWASMVLSADAHTVVVGDPGFNFGAGESFVLATHQAIPPVRRPGRR